MKIKLESQDLPEEVVQSFAVFNGWVEKVAQSDFEGNQIVVDNPITYIEFIKDKFGTPIWTAVSEWNLQKAQESFNKKVQEAQEELNIARDQTDEIAKQIVEVTVE
jgi:transcriptional regulator with AAA-type ATPase domain